MTQATLFSHRPNAANDEWLTPLEIIHALGPFDLDPCAPVARPWDTADRHYTKQEDGLRMPWAGSVWMNPPYSDVEPWVSKLAAHGDGVALVFARTETQWFFRHVWEKASGIFFFQGRLHFYNLDGERAKGNAGAPNVLVSYGPTAAARLAGLRIPGVYLAINQRGYQ